MKKNKLLALVAVVGFIVLIVLLMLLPRQNQGDLVIRTNNNDDKVYLTSISNKTMLVGTGNYIRSTVQVGQYSVEAINQNRSSQAVVSVQPKSITSVFLPINPTVKTSEVANFSAQDLSVSGSDVKFLNTTLQQIYDYNSASNTRQSIATNLYPVSKMLWINHTSGVAIDNIGEPHLVIGQNDSPLSITTTTTGSNLVVMDFAVNNNGDFAYSQDGNVYLSRQGIITKIGSDTSSEIQVRLATDDTVFVNGINPTNPNITTIDIGVPTKSKAYFITSSGQKIIYPGSETINQAAWSPDSQNIAVSTSKDLAIYNYKTKKSALITLGGANPSGSFNWIDADHLLYVNQSTIWEYDLSQNTSYKLAKAPGNINHAVPFAVSDNNIVYFSTDPTNAVGTGAAIYKINP